MLFRSDRKSTRLNSSHTLISYAVFCLKKKKNINDCHRHTQKHATIAVEVNEQRPLGVDARLPDSVCRVAAACAALSGFFFFFNDTATTEIYTLSLHDALPIYSSHTLISYAVFCLRDESVTG